MASNEGWHRKVGHNELSTYSQTSGVDWVGSCWSEHSVMSQLAKLGMLLHHALYNMGSFMLSIPSMSVALSH